MSDKNASPDDEVAAMKAIVDAFVPLGDDERCRVIRWAADRYDVTLRVQIAEMPDDEVIPRHEFSQEHQLHLFSLDMCEITCPDCPATFYPDYLGQALDWALGHKCGEQADA